VRAAVLYEFGAPLHIQEVETDPPGRDEVLVRYLASGICHSDWHMVQGIHPAPLPAIFGHEGAGIVEQVGADVAHLAPGDHVVVTWLPYCGHCRFCASGRPNLCTELGWSDAGTMADGSIRFHREGQRIHHNTASSFAERAVIPAQTAIRVAPDLPLRELALLGCAVTTGVGAVLNTARVRPGESVAVVGCGGVGLNIIQGAAIAGAHPIIAIDRVAEKLDLARSLGATHGVNAADQDVESGVERICPGGTEYTFEALGTPATIELAARLTARGGTTVLVGMAPPRAQVHLDALSLTVQEKTIRGSWYGSCRPLVDIPALVELYRAGKLRLDPLISVTCGLDEINEAFARMDRGEGARTVILYG